MPTIIYEDSNPKSLDITGFVFISNDGSVPGKGMYQDTYVRNKDGSITYFKANGSPITLADLPQKNYSLQTTGFGTTTTTVSTPGGLFNQYKPQSIQLKGTINDEQELIGKLIDHANEQTQKLEKISQLTRSKL